MKQNIGSHVINKNNPEVVNFVTRNLTKQDTKMYQQGTEMCILRLDVSIDVGPCENVME